MIPVPLVVVIYFLAVGAIIGMATGTFAGFLASLALRLGRRGIVKDGLLGSLGFLAGVIGCAVLPWPRNTIVTYHTNGTFEESTMGSYQHPYAVAFIVAVLLPLLHEIYRFKRSKSN